MSAASDTLLVTGIHREELPFGDNVATLLKTDAIDIMRIPKGISNRHVGTDGGFYFSTQHREIYLQLRQQTKGRYRLLIDLHCGANDAGHCADIFCHDTAFLDCLAAQPEIAEAESGVRLIKIVASNQPFDPDSPDRNSVADAQTWIPSEVWRDAECTYVGLEVYLPDSAEGVEADWRFSRRLIEAIRACNDATMEA